MPRPYKNTAPEIEWKAAAEQFPCPNFMWQGIFGEVATHCGTGWDIWGAVYCALGAWAGRQLHWQYVRSSIFGMAYVLIVGPTGTGKEYCADVCEALLEGGPHEIRGAVQSGPALFPLLADPGSNGRIRQGRSVVLVAREWTKFIHNSGIQNSTLADDLNDLFHKAGRWSISRSDRELSGGDRVVLKPTLSILGTATPSSLLKDVPDILVDRGFLNRYVILPGPMEEWRFHPPNDERKDPKTALPYLMERLSKFRRESVWGGGAKFRTGFEENAFEKLGEWGAPYFEPLMREQTIAANRKKRLHMYAHQIALLYAWQAGRDKVQLSDIEPAIAAADTASRFLDFLYSNEVIPLTVGETSISRVEEAVLKRIRERPGFFDKKKLRESLRRNEISYSMISKVVDRLRSDGFIIKDPDRGGLVMKEDEA